MDNADSQPRSGSMALFDVLTADVEYLKSLLESGSTSVDLVKTYLDQIRKHNDYLHAMLSIPSEETLLEIANDLDQERKDGASRSPLHGVPIIIKENIATCPEMGMNTSAGNFALLESKPAKNAKVVDKLIKAGLIILGKTNLSELANWKSVLLVHSKNLAEAIARGSNISGGWSAVGGQTQSAYVRGGADPNDSKDGHSKPSGSSSGSAVGVSAGFAPFSIGTETDGSLICPANRAALYTIKPTVGTVSSSGVIPISHLFDSPGPMAKNPYDMALLLDQLVEEQPLGQVSYTEVLDGSWSQFSVATLDPEIWTPATDEVKPVPVASEQIIQETKAAYNKISTLAKSYLGEAPLISEENFQFEGRNSRNIVRMTDFVADINAYLSALVSSPVRTLEELIRFNVDHADIELPPENDSQDRLTSSFELHASPQEYAVNLDYMRQTARAKGIDHILDGYKMDVIIGPSECGLGSFAAAAGYPIASLPLGYLDYNGRPFGLCCVAKANQEALLLKVQSAWEVTFGPRRPPPSLV